MSERRKDGPSTAELGGPVVVSRLTPILSEPVDVPGPGRYTLSAGPVRRAEFNENILNYDVPRDTAFTLRFIGKPRLVERPTGPAIVVEVEVSAPAPAYRGWRLWMY